MASIAFIFSGSGLNPSGVSLCPKNLQSVDKLDFIRVEQMVVHCCSLK